MSGRTTHHRTVLAAAMPQERQSVNRLKPHCPRAVRVKAGHPYSGHTSYFAAAPSPAATNADRAEIEVQLQTKKPLAAAANRRG